MFLAAVAFSALATPASATGVACSTYHTVYTKGGEGTTESYGKDCPVAVNEGPYTVCIGYGKDTVHHDSGPDERPSTEVSESCDKGVDPSKFTDLLMGP